MNSATHLCLVHNTATANVAPALDPAFRPQECVLMFASGKADRAAALQTVLEPAGIKVSSWPLEDAWNTEHVRDRVLEFLLSREHDDIALNTSGGTRPMCIGAYEIFHEFGKPVFYVHPETDRVTWLHRRDLPSFDLANKIKLRAFVQAHGADLIEQGERRGVPAPLRELGADLAQNAARLARPLGTVNWLAHRAEESLVSPALAPAQKKGDLVDLIDRFSEAGLCQLNGSRLEFSSEEARFFVNGGWLEDYTYGLLYGLRGSAGPVQDLGRGLQIARGAGSNPVRNELDVGFLANNRMHIVECKTKRFDNSRKTESADVPGADVLYKLDTLKGLLGGVRTRTMLVSFHPLSKWDLGRAKDLGIRVCTAEQLPRLKESLARWIAPAKSEPLVAVGDE